MTDLNTARRARLLAGASIVALLMTTGVTVAQAQTTVSVEAGIPCPFGDQTQTSATQRFYDGTIIGTQTARRAFGISDCGGWNGRIGLAQAKPGAFLGLDYWGVFLRRSELHHASFSDGVGITPSLVITDDGVRTQGITSEDRTVVDFEVGKDLGIGSGTNLRAIAGLRYARQHSRLGFGATTNEGNYGAVASTSIRLNRTFEGLGPRLGLTARLPITSSIGLSLGGSGSVLWGDHSLSGTAIDACTVAAPNACSSMTSLGLTQSSGSVTNLEGEAAVVFAIPSLNGAELSLGVRAESWFGISGPSHVGLLTNTVGPLNAAGVLPVSTAAGAAGSLDRHEWGPFLRLTVPLSAK